MKNLKLYEEFNGENFDIDKVEKFEKSILQIIDEMEEEFDDGDDLEEPDDANVSEQMDELINDLKLNKYDMKEIIKRNDGKVYRDDSKRNHLNDFIHLLEWYLGDNNRLY